MAVYDNDGRESGDLTTASALDRVRVVLVRPRIAGNLGGVARVMRNFGFSNLVLVAPEASIHDRSARQRSTQGEAILESARIMSDLSGAIDDCILAVGASARTGGLYRRQTVQSSDTLGSLVLDGGRQGPVALVFGPERNGLSNEETRRCHHLVTIPTSNDYPSLNLSQAVGLCLYEVRKTWLATRHQRPREQDSPAASIEKQERMFLLLEASLERVGFLRGERKGALMHALRHLIGRSLPSEMEVNLLIGLARQLDWLAEEKVESRK